MNFERNLLYLIHEEGVDLKTHRTQLIQVGATVRHFLTSFQVKIQVDHFSIGNGSYMDVHKFIWA